MPTLPGTCSDLKMGHDSTPDCRRLVMGMLLGLAVVAFTVIAPAASKDEAPSVEVSNFLLPFLGVTIRGQYENTSAYGRQPVHGQPILHNSGHEVESFIGIPFAKPPVGSRRFQKTSLKGVNPFSYSGFSYDATKWKPGCMAEYGMFTTETDKFSEDCLYLNIWRRRGTTRHSKKPVVVVIYGGGYSAGDGHETDWRGSQLAYFGDVIAVNFNYRLGMFGFLDLGLPGQAEGNMGHHDQIVALQWLKRYIRFFGGDHRRVMVIGVSAGSFSISAHLMTGAADGLFHAALMDAGVLTFFHAETRQQQWDRMSDFDNATGCDAGEGDTPAGRLRCLKRLSSSKLLELQGHWAVSQTYTFRPTYVEQPECRINHDRFGSRVPLIIGDTTNEGQFLTSNTTHDPLPELSTPDQVIDWNFFILGHHQAENAPIDDNDTIAQVYRLNDMKSVEDYQNASAQFIGDGLFVCPVMNFAKHFSRGSPTYFYRWDRIRVNETFPGERKNGAYHGLMFYTGTGSEYLELGADIASADKNYIFWTIGMISDLARNPSKPPKFNKRPLQALKKEEVNNFYNEGYNVLSEHPKHDVCETVWPVFKTAC